MKIKLYQGDLPDGLDLGPLVAIDTETLGLNPNRDRLCLAQLSAGRRRVPCGAIRRRPVCRAESEEDCWPIPRSPSCSISPVSISPCSGNIWGWTASRVYCTKIASKLVRTYTDKHGLKDLVRELLNVDLSKEQQSLGLGREELSEKQLAYAANDVAYLHQLKTVLDAMLAREGRTELAQACFDFLPTRAELDLAGWEEVDIFAH